MLDEIKDGEKPNLYSIRAVERVCDILDLLQSSEGDVPLSRIASAAGIPKSSAFRYLTTLESRRYVERGQESGDYRLGLALLPLRLRQLDILTDRARPYLEKLREDLGETSNLGMLDGTRIGYLAIVESPKAMRLSARLIDRDPIHSTALGKAIAAHLPEEQVRSILAAEGMPAITERTITTVEAFLAELELVRAQGYAIDDRENESAGRCLAVPVQMSSMPLAVSISAPVSRLPFDQVGTIVEMLSEASSALGRDLALGVVDPA